MKRPKSSHLSPVLSDVEFYIIYVCVFPSAYLSPISLSPLSYVCVFPSTHLSPLSLSIIMCVCVSLPASLSSLSLHYHMCVCFPPRISLLSFSPLSYVCVFPSPHLSPLSLSVEDHWLIRPVALAITLIGFRRINKSDNTFHNSTPLRSLRTDPFK